MKRWNWTTYPHAIRVDIVPSGAYREPLKRPRSSDHRITRLRGRKVSMSRRRCLGFLAAALLTVSPNPVFAQGTSAASITGLVTDTSGAVLPGVTVEASSPVLIEKVRSAVTDERGEYRIVELRPGTYTVAFTLGALASFKREALELPPSFNATVNP